MNKATDPVLELLEDSGLALPPNAIIVNVQRGLSDPPSEPTFYRTLGPLEENGFIETIPEREKFYRITEKGRRYLAGEDPETKD